MIQIAVVVPVQDPEPPKPPEPISQTVTLAGVEAVIIGAVGAGIAAILHTCGMDAASLITVGLTAALAKLMPTTLLGMAKH